MTANATLFDRPAQRGRTGVVSDAQWAEIVAQLTRRELIGTGALTALTLPQPAQAGRLTPNRRSRGEAS